MEMLGKSQTISEVQNISRHETTDFPKSVECNAHEFFLGFFPSVFCVDTLSLSFHFLLLFKEKSERT